MQEEYRVTQSAVRRHRDHRCLGLAREQVLERARAHPGPSSCGCCNCPTIQLEELLALGHEFGCAGAAPKSSRGIISLKTGVAPRTATSVRSRGSSLARFAVPGWTSPAWWRPPSRPRSPAPPKFCIVAAVRGPDERLLAQVPPGSRPSATRSTSRSPARWACSPRSRWDRLSAMGVHRYNHNLETARSFFTNVVTNPYVGGALGDAGHGPRCGHGGVLRRHPRMGETLEQRAEFAPTSPNSTATRCR